MAVWGASTGCFLGPGFFEGDAVRGLVELPAGVKLDLFFAASWRANPQRDRNQ